MAPHHRTRSSSPARTAAQVSESWNATENGSEIPPDVQSFIDRDAKGPKNTIGFFDYESAGEAGASEWAERFTAAILATRQYQDQHIPCDEPAESGEPVVTT